MLFSSHAVQAKQNPMKVGCNLCFGPSFVRIPFVPIFIDYRALSSRLKQGHQIYLWNLYVNRTSKICCGELAEGNL